MKKITILALSLLVLSVTLFAQEEKKEKTFGYFNRTDAGVGFGVGKFKTDIFDGIQKRVKNDEIIIAFNTINGITYKGRIGLGIGVGVEKWQHGLFFPVFGQLYYDFKPKDNTFFANLSVGSAIGKRDSTTFFHQGDGGLIFQLGVGYKMKVFKRLRFYYEVFYKYQAIHSSYTVWTSTDSIPYTSNVDYKVPYHFLGFRIGISFY